MRGREHFTIVVTGHLFVLSTIVGDIQWASGARGRRYSVGRLLFLLMLFISGIVRTVAKFTNAMLTVPPSICLLKLSRTGIILGIVT